MSHVFVVQLDIPAEHEAEFNRVYDTEHFPMLSKVPGVRSAARYRLEHSTVPGMQRYLTIYELDSPDVLKSAAWEKAGSFGDWATKIRPLTTSRHHSVFERIAKDHDSLIAYTAKSGMREAILKGFTPTAGGSRRTGLHQYGPTVDAEGIGSFQTKFGPDTFVVIEKWESPEALKAHATSPHMAAYAAKTRDLIASRVIHVLQPG